MTEAQQKEIAHRVNSLVASQAWIDLELELRGEMETAIDALIEARDSETITDLQADIRGIKRLLRRVDDYCDIAG